VIDPDEWTAQEPPRGFADGVMDRIAREERAETGDRLGRGAGGLPHRARPAARHAGIVASLALAASVALAIGLRDGGTSHGEAIAREREQVALGARAVAVLESGAHVAWDGDLVNQPAGDVFYRVEPGAAFRVHTPAGDVQVLGTCFRVRVDATEASVNGRDIKAAGIGAALGAAALVSVYEGKVRVSHASDALTLGAGQSARADARGVRRTGDGGDGIAAADTPDTLLAANAGLADSVRGYKERLDAIAAQKKGLEKQLAEAQEKLALAQNDGQAPPSKSPYDLAQDDWKKLAEEGTVAARYPCPQGNGTQHPISADSLQKAGLSPSDGPLLEQAMNASRARMWATIRPLCASALQGDAAMADKLGPSTCESLVKDVAAANGTDVPEDMREVAEIRAGMRPMPSNGGDAVMKMMMAITGESSAMEQDLAQQVGPDDAHALVFGDNSPGCWQNSRWGVGPRPSAP
jgi:ferric-dicitrate binding protein FerR (iron transport regulator)